MKVNTSIKAGKIAGNHNETQARKAAKAMGLRVKTSVKAGKLAGNHNETQVHSRDC